MALNPLVYTEKVVQSFLRYQLSAYPFADPRLHTQMRDLLSLETARETPLLRGPYVSLSRAFRAGATVDALVSESVLHPHMRQLIPYPAVYGHQDEAIRSVAAGKTTLVSTGTGSGKSECFLYPIISRCLALRDEGAGPGICAVLVYPMNALAEDQLLRLRELLAGTGISFGMYVGKTPERDSDVTGRRLAAGSSSTDYRKAFEAARARGDTTVVHPPEEVCSREIMRTAGRQPRILLTNVKQLELLLTRQSDVELFDDARLDFLVFDEAHTFTGAQGAETACLIRRLRSFCGRDADKTVCVATSATIVDEGDPDAARSFASRFFGVERADVVTVNEVYEEAVWASTRTVPAAPSDPIASLKSVLSGVDAGSDADTAVRQAWQSLSGTALGSGPWEAELHRELSANELLYQASGLLEQPKALSDLLADLEKGIGRAVSEEELILWLTLGAAARDDGRPLVRPVVHGFLRGVPGAVVTFDDQDDHPRLLLSAEDEEDGEVDRLRLKVSTCTTCGQHYYEHRLAGFEFTGKAPGGGTASDEHVLWESTDMNHGGQRLLLVDQLISADDGDTLDHHQKLSPVHLCRSCGAAHDSQGARCLSCGREGRRLTLFAVQQKDGKEGHLASCVCCGSSGRMSTGRFREPAKPVRATNVADVHVLAQDMIQHAERQRLLVFADNRQDAAFQAGWMQDHARRFRLRSLMVKALDQGALSVGDLAHKLDIQLEADDDLSHTLVPEVWAVARKESAGTVHRDERRYFLRILVLRELTMSQRQQIGLEPWGRVRVKYEGLDEGDAFVRKWADRLSLPADEIVGGISALLDMERRRRILLDPEGQIFSKFWGPGSRELLNGYLPEMNDVPKGLKLTRDGSDDSGRLSQWVSATGHRTTAHDAVLKWGVQKEDVGDFLKELWDYLVSPEVNVLAPVTLKGQRGNALPNCPGARQVNADKILIVPNTGAHRCRKCRRRTARRTPHGLCMAWRCDGTLDYVPEDKDNYDLQVLDQEYSMLRPREHTAMVPNSEREKIEQIFKSDSDAINTLVCTQTLELGVDIGALDAILMRNVPPLPANYWQRAGRAGRRHRMAVNIAYCRPVSHDRAYFAEPVKMLAGRVDPPAFNLANGLMVAKHVHATALTRLHQLARPSSALTETDRDDILLALRTAFPPTISEYLFDERGRVRPSPSDVTGLHTEITKHLVDLEQSVGSAFGQGWPQADHEVVSPARLRHHLVSMTDNLRVVVRRLHRRLTWALEQMQRLEARRLETGVLDEEEQSFYDRCGRFVRRLKRPLQGRHQRRSRADDVVTYSVLAKEGFLPGYGLDSGTVVGMAEVPRSVRGLEDFDLPRVPSVAIREYVPGNLIYANGQKFVPKRYALEVGEDRRDALVFDVEFERRALQEAQGDSSGALTTTRVSSLPICDVTLVHNSRISDEEESRFQMGVSVFGRELGHHEGGQAYTWGTRDLHLRKGVRLQLVNVGPTSVFHTRQELGYPVCRVCGQSVSPFSSQRQRDDFTAKHQEWCGQDPQATGFHADLVVDALGLPGCTSREEAYSMMEALRAAAAEVIDMHLEDLQVLVLGRTDSDETDAILYDSMPGGSGLLQQICERFDEVTTAAEIQAKDCPSLCTSSCIDCYQNYRNAFYHEHLDRHLIEQRLDEWGHTLVVEHVIPPLLPSRAPEPESRPVNSAERKLKRMLEAAQLPAGQWQESRVLPRPLNSTTPDVSFDDPDEVDRKILIYLDGLSRHLHGNPETRERDNQIRQELRSQGHDVLEITAADLDDRQAMTRHFKKLARLLIGRDLVQQVDEQAGEWFARGLEVSWGSAGTPAATEEPGMAAESPNLWLSEVLEVTDSDWHSLLTAIAESDLPAPQPGYPLPGKGAIRSDAEADLAWPGRKLALFSAANAATAALFTDIGWTVLTGPEGTEQVLAILSQEERAE